MHLSPLMGLPCITSTSLFKEQDVEFRPGGLEYHIIGADFPDQKDSLLTFETDALRTTTGLMTQEKNRRRPYRSSKQHQNTALSRSISWSLPTTRHTEKRLARLKATKMEFQQMMDHHQPFEKPLGIVHICRGEEGWRIMERAVTTADWTPAQFRTCTRFSTFKIFKRKYSPLYT